MNATSIDRLLATSLAAIANCSTDRAATWLQIPGPLVAVYDCHHQDWCVMTKEAEQHPANYTWRGTCYAPCLVRGLNEHQANAIIEILLSKHSKAPAYMKRLARRAMSDLKTEAELQAEGGAS